MTPVLRTHPDRQRLCAAVLGVMHDTITGALANKLRPSLVQAGLDPDTLVSGRKFDLSKLDADTKKWRDLWSAGHGVGAVAAREPVAQIIASLNAQYRAASDR